ncbi:MAG: CotH kinase family protein [Myxococcota bacterium]|nr:CotH kinase family protein [Myxococcota bacterium]
MFPLPFLLAAACAPGNVDLQEPSVSDETLAGEIPDSDWIFDDSLIHEIEIRLSPEAWADLEALPYEYTQASVLIDGVSAGEVGVRLRGKVGSFRPISGKPKFKLDFNRIHPGRRFYGLEALSLNNEVADCSYLKEPLGYEVIRQAGGPASRTAFAHVQVNGADYGLYVLIETQDDRFLARNWDDGSGNLYDGKYLYDWTTGAYTLLDFTPELQDHLQQEEGEDVGHADIHGITDAIAGSWNTGAFMSGTSEVIDWPAMHTHLVAEQWIQQNDGYALNANNYRVYFNPEDGQAELISWDLDNSFMPDFWSYTWTNPRGLLVQGCWQDAACVADWKAAAQELHETLDTADLAARYEAWDELTFRAAIEDPRRECSEDQLRSERLRLRAWIDERPAQFSQAWGL